MSLQTTLLDELFNRKCLFILTVTIYIGYRRIRDEVYHAPLVECVSADDYSAVVLIHGVDSDHLHNKTATSSDRQLDTLDSTAADPFAVPSVDRVSNRTRPNHNSFVPNRAGLPLHDDGG